MIHIQINRCGMCHLPRTSPVIFLLKTSLIRDEHNGNGRHHGHYFQIVTAFLRLYKTNKDVKDVFSTNDM